MRFSPEGGVVWITLKSADGYIVLSVRDQGPSLPESDRGRIFQPFERAQRTSRIGGLGLGLYISRQIAQMHGGDVRLAESMPGKGNLFEARFPIKAGIAITGGAA
jgi:signal transduction histidine kinase